jgi:EAL and modified HD-GYP domain-containing signal transduction protein
MSEASVARQPIFDRRLQVVGYELLFRGPRAVNGDVLDNENATTTVALNALTEIGLQRIVGSHRAWINASREFLLNGLALALPPGLIGYEILEEQAIDDELIAAVADLGQRGYALSLDDYQFTPETEPLLELVDIVKLDFLALGRKGMAEHATRLRPYGVQLLAEKVEAHEDHHYCLDLGCELFQGFFYRKPELLTNRRIEANRLSLLKLMAALHDPATDLHAVEQLITRDVTLSLRLLRYINSAFFGLRHEVSSVKQALALLGLENLRGWTTLTIFAAIDTKPSELTINALLRARFCELAGETDASGDSQLFTLGLFSVIDALMDAPIEEILKSIPFPPEMLSALVSRQGEMGRLLDCVIALEAGDFDCAETLLPGAGHHYVEALSWTTDAAQQLFDDSGLVAA